MSEKCSPYLWTKIQKTAMPSLSKYFFVQNCLYSEHTMILRFDEPRTGLCWLCSQGVYTRPPNTSTLSQTSPNDQEWTKRICHVTKNLQIMAKHFKGPLPLSFYVLLCTFHTYIQPCFARGNFLSGPCPFIALPCQSVNQSVTHWPCWNLLKVFNFFKFVTGTFLSCYMDLSKLLYGFLYVVSWISENW